MSQFLNTLPVRFTLYSYDVSYRERNASSGSPDGGGVVNISNLQHAVATMGPVAIGIDANSALHQFYQGGYYSGNCTFTGSYVRSHLFHSTISPRRSTTLCT